MKLLLFSDLHLDRPFAWAGLEAGRKRRQALRDTLTRICDLAGMLQVDALCCGGDLYEDEHKSLDTGNFVRDAFARLHPLPIYLAPGNHDWLGPASLYQRIVWSENVHVFRQPELRPMELIGGVTLWGAAHCQPAFKLNLLENFRADHAGVNLALFHGSEQHLLASESGDKVGHAPFRAEQVRAARLNYALLGHYHTPKDMPDFTYPGNPDPLTFGEDGSHGAVLVTVASDGSVHTERHRVSSTEVADVQVCLDGATNFDEVRQRVADRVAGMQGVVRVTLMGELAEDVVLDLPALATVAPGLEALVPRVGALSMAFDLETLAAEQTVRGRFVRNVQRAPDLSDDDRRRIVITGLRAFSGRKDLEVY